MNASVRHLPPSIAWLAPELTSLPLPEETRADCANCPMAGRPFHRTIRCCTYEPALPNFLAGRALRRKDAGARNIRARLRTGVGLSPLGIQPDPAWSEAYVQNRETDFGRNPDWKCPYWVEGPLSCSIWPDRNAVCRSWHCKHTEGFRGHGLWVAVRKLAATCEQRISAWCAEQECAPSNTDSKEWARYYEACSRRIERATPDDLEVLRDPDLDALRRDLTAAYDGLDRPMPEVMGVEVRQVVQHDGEVELVGYTPWNTARFPHTVFALLAEFDGERPHQEALRRAIAASPTVDPAWVPTLWDIGVLRARDDGDAAPWGFGGADLTPELLQKRFERGPS